MKGLEHKCMSIYMFIYMKIMPARNEIEVRYEAYA